MGRHSNRDQISKLLTPPQQALSSNAPVAVIGAGLAGCSVARALADRGRAVHLFERETAIATQTSAHPAAVVFPMVAKQPTILRRFFEAAYAAIQVKIQALMDHEGFDDWHPTGAIHLLVNDRLQQIWQNLDITKMAPEHVQAWTDDQVASVTDGILSKAALAYPTAGYIQPRSWCQSLIECEGIVLRRHHDALEIKAGTKGWQIATGREKHEASAVVLAGGLDVIGFEQSNWLPLRCFRGQMAYIPLANAAQFPRQVICHEGYLIPNCGVGHLAGATFHPESRDPHLKHESQQRLVDQIQHWLPGFLNQPLPLKGRVAFRAHSPDHLPMVGPVANHEAFARDFADLHHGKLKAYPQPQYHPHLYASVGHASRGTVSCWLAGEIIAQQICGGPAVLDDEMLSELNPARFILRALRRNQPLRRPAMMVEDFPARLSFKNPN